MPETPATTSSAAIVFPEGRYGRRRAPRKSRRLLTAGLAVLVAVLTMWVASRLYVAYGDGDYTASVTGFGDITDKQVVITIRVRIPADGQAVCLLRARDQRGSEVGREEVMVKAGADPARTDVTHKLATRERPVTGEVQGCRPA